MKKKWTNKCSIIKMCIFLKTFITTNTAKTFQGNFLQKDVKICLLNNPSLKIWRITGGGWDGWKWSNDMKAALS
jgi:hypothetical protein